MTRAALSLAPCAGRRRLGCSRHVSGSLRTHYAPASRDPTLERQDRATSLSVVSNAQRTSNVAVDVRWKALSVKVLGNKEWNVEGQPRRLWDSSHLYERIISRSFGYPVRFKHPLWSIATCFGVFRFGVVDFLQGC
jgi:hypothetical protein